MATVRSVRDYKNLFRKRFSSYKEEVGGLSAETARNIKKTAKRLAPMHTGKTKQGIRTRKKKKKWVVSSTVPGSFKQNLFANRSPPFRTLSFSRGNRFYREKQTVVYGKGAVSPSGKPIRWTGKAGFFDLAVRSEIPNYRSKLKKVGAKSLK